MLAVRSTYNIGRYVASEGDATFATMPGVRGEKPLLVWCHGNNQTALSDYDSYNTELHLLAQDYFVVAADLGGSLFGNDTQITRVGQVLDYFGASTAYLLGVSMGACTALNYANAHPERVIAVAGVIPALDLDVDDAHPTAANIDAAYPPSYDPQDAGMAAHSPVNFAASMSASLSVALWTSSDDTTCPPATADAFVASRPQTQRTVFGAYGHGGIGVAVPLAAAWLRTV